MPPEDWRQTRDIAWVDCEALIAEFCYRLLHVNCVPVGDSVQNQAKGAELFFLSLAQCISHFTMIPMIDFARQFVPKLLSVKLNKNAPAEIGIIDIIGVCYGSVQETTLRKITY